jgi:hypothetical protein
LAAATERWRWAALRLAPIVAQPARKRIGNSDGFILPRELMQRLDMM